MEIKSEVQLGILSVVGLLVFVYGWEILNEDFVLLGIFILTMCCLTILAFWGLGKPIK